MFPSLSLEQRQAIKREGTPLPLINELTTSIFILLRVELVCGPDQRNFTAQIPGIAAFGEGETEQEASIALCEALRSYLETFSDQ